MLNIDKIITIGLYPCWDITCYVDGIEWDQHKRICKKTAVPAGKAFNISRALNWMGRPNIAAGLWGQDDYQQMSEAAGTLTSVSLNLTPTTGRTRDNITVIDTINNREMHLRSESTLANHLSLNQLKKDLDQLVDASSLCIFAGSMPKDSNLNKCLELISLCISKQAQVIVDTSDTALQQCVNQGGLFAIKPNVTELCELMNKQINDEPACLIEIGKRLLDNVKTVIISRGKNGAIVITREAVYSAIHTGLNAVNTGCCSTCGAEMTSTVGCGDYLLAGFVNGIIDEMDPASAIEQGVLAATARYRRMSETTSWEQAQKALHIEIESL